MRVVYSLLCLTLVSTPLFASGDPVLGKQKAQSCLFCHGTDGKATQVSYPNLDGQSAEYLYSAMKAYQLGEPEMMRAQLQRLNDQDLRDIAAFYASSQ